MHSDESFDLRHAIALLSYTCKRNPAHAIMYIEMVGKTHPEMCAEFSKLIVDGAIDLTKADLMEGPYGRIARTIFSEGDVK